MKELVTSCAVGKIEGKIAIDLSDLEDKLGEADMPIALMPRLNAITLIQMDGNFAQEEFEKALAINVEACKKIHEMQKEALKQKYLMIKETVEEKNESEGVE